MMSDTKDFDYRAALATEYSEPVETASQKRINELEAAIKNHRDQRGDDRCWVDDQELYQVLGDEKANTALPPKEIFMENCARFHASRQAPGDQLVQLQQGFWCSAEELAKFKQQEEELQFLSSNGAKLKPEYKTHEDQARPEMDRFVSRYGLQIALNCLIAGLKSLQRALEECEVKDTSDITSVVKDLEMTLKNYKNRYNDD